MLMPSNIIEKFMVCYVDISTTGMGFPETRFINMLISMV